MVKTYKKGVITQLSKNFKSSEFDCHGKNCCNKTLIDENLIAWLQKIREHFNASININSGYRCVVHNKNIGGANGSHHTKGMAADIRVKGVSPKEVAQYAESIGIQRIGLYEGDAEGNFVHIGSATTKSFWLGHASKKVDTFFENPVLRRGMKNENVRELQDLLISLGYQMTSLDGKTVYKADGSFGAGTERAVKKFQKDRGLEDDGVVGPATWKALRSFIPYKGVTTAILLNVRKGPGTSHQAIKQIKNNTAVEIVYEKDGWGKLKSTEEQWVSLKHIKKVR